jgi:hypothetical protein
MLWVIVIAETVTHEINYTGLSRLAWASNYRQWPPRHKVIIQKGDSIRPVVARRSSQPQFTQPYSTQTVIVNHGVPPGYPTLRAVWFQQYRQTNR